MSVFEGASLLFTLVVVFGWLNLKTFRLPDTLGVTAVALVITIFFSAFGFFNPVLVEKAQTLVEQINFTDLIFHGFLSVLLFAGSLFVDLKKLREHTASVLLLATVGVVISTAILGYGFHYLSVALGQPIPLIWCLVFGAAMSPTDPIAVLSVLKKAGAPAPLEAKITGESLFNDGTAVVAFLTLLALATGAGDVSVASVSMALAREIVGALALGLLVGWVGAKLIEQFKESHTFQLVTTLAAAFAGYLLAEYLHVSAPLMVVVTGLTINNHPAFQDLREEVKHHIHKFWEFADEICNLLLFSLIGLEILALDLHLQHLWIGLAAVPVMLIARFASIAMPMYGLFRFRSASPGTLPILTWGGLRGGISIALVLSLPAFEGRTLVIGVAYVLVIFSLLVQATTLGPMVKKICKTTDA